MTHMKRNETRQVRCGDVLIGGGAPVSIQSMTMWIPAMRTR